MIDLQTWRKIPAPYADRPCHAHNRLISSVQMSADERRGVARAIAAKLAIATGPSVFLLPLQGIEEWDRAGQGLHDPEGLATFVAAIRASITAPTELIELPCHINDPAFVETVLSTFDGWIANGSVPPGGVEGTAS
jgi:uncharacterized protein (UPF0261 family)